VCEADCVRISIYVLCVHIQNNFVGGNPRNVRAVAMEMTVYVSVGVRRLGLGRGRRRLCACMCVCVREREREGILGYAGHMQSVK